MTDISELIVRRAEAIERGKGFSIPLRDMPSASIIDKEKALVNKLSSENKSVIKKELVKLYTAVYADGNSGLVRDFGAVGSRKSEVLIVCDKRTKQELWIKYANTLVSAKEVWKNNLGIDELNNAQALEATLYLSHGPLHNVSLKAQKTADVQINHEPKKSIAQIIDFCNRYFFNPVHVKGISGQQRKELEFLLTAVEDHNNKIKTFQKESLAKDIYKFKDSIISLASNSEPVTLTAYDFQLPNLFDYAGKLFLGDLGLAYDRAISARDKGFKMMWGNPAFPLGFLVESTSQNPRICSAFKEQLEILVARFVYQNEWLDSYDGQVLRLKSPFNFQLKKFLYGLGQFYGGMLKVRTNELAAEEDRRKIRELVTRYTKAPSK
jgi:hypothetical protein